MTSTGERDFFATRGRAVAWALVALALVVRAPGLFEWWLSPDEGIYYSIVTHERWATFWSEAGSTAHPPLYFMMLRAVGALSTDFRWLRAVALVSGAAAVYVFVVAGRELGGGGTRGWVTGLLAGTLLAFSPRAIVLSGVIRPYMLLLVLLGASLALLLRYLRSPGTRTLIAYVACASLATMLHYSAVFGLAVLATVVLQDGIRRGMRRPEWRRLLAAHAVPGATLALLYVWHLSRFMGSVEAENTLACCLLAYMVGSPTDAWLGIVGFHSTFAGEALAVPASLLSLSVAVWALWSRAWIPLLMITGGVGIAIAASLTHTYPFGPTRHGVWLLTFVVPALAWGLSAPLVAGRARRLGVAGIALLVVGSRPLSALLDSELRPREISERVIQRAHLSAMGEVLGPEVGPELVLMSTETYRVLIPLFWRERQSFDESRDGLLYRFRWGGRQVVVLPARDFVALPHQVGEPHHLYTAMQVARDDFGIELPEGGDPVMVIAAGYESRGMADLVRLARRSGPLGTTTSVPGVIALSLDAEAYERALFDPSG